MCKIQESCAFSRKATLGSVLWNTLNKINLIMCTEAQVIRFVFTNNLTRVPSTFTKYKAQRYNMNKLIFLAIMWYCTLFHFTKFKVLEKEFRTVLSSVV